MELGGDICVNIASDWWYMLLINELHWSKQCWKLSAKCCMILPLRKKGEKTQADYLTETPVGKVCPSSLGVCSPPVWAVWEESESSHGGLHLVVFLGMVTKPICLPTSSWVHRDPCATVHASSIFLLEPWMPQLWHLAEAVWGGGSRNVVWLQPFPMPFWGWGI